jgi:hypothetical protein
MDRFQKSVLCTSARVERGPTSSVTGSSVATSTHDGSLGRNAVRSAKRLSR